MYISVVIDITSSSIDQVYEYHVNDELSPFLAPGERVRVKFTNVNRSCMGVIVEVYSEKRFDGDTKDIEELLDYTPLLNNRMLELAEFLKEDCVCPKANILDVMIPKVLRISYKKYLKVVDFNLLDARLVNLFNGLDVIPWNDSFIQYSNIIKMNIENGGIIISYDQEKEHHVKKDKKYLLNKAYYFENINKAKTDRQYDFLQKFLSESEPLTKKEIMEKYEVSTSIIDRLTDNNYLYYFEEDRVHITNKHENLMYRDNYSKKNVSMLDKFSSNELPYLYVPTSSDDIVNTLIELAEDTIKHNKNVIVVAPEILTTYKYAALLKEVFDTKIGCINSTLSDNEMYDYFKAIKNDEYKIIVTSSKGVFMPYDNVGLIFMLDEDSDNYFNDQAPRYDMHRVLYYIARQFSSKFIMTSLSPSISSYCYSLKGYYRSVITKSEDTVRDVETIDLKDELKNGNDTFISKSLLEKVKYNQKNNISSLLICNNKNYSSYVLCRECGFVPKCSKCGITLRYNDKLHALICPACGAKYPYDDKCPKCGSTNMMYGGIGIESIEANLKQYFNDNDIVIFDNSRYKDLENVQRAISFEPKIVISTETCFKALPSHTFGIVGIINFDSILKNPSYEAESKAFSLLTNAYEMLKEDSTLLVQTTDLQNQPLMQFTADNFYEFLKNEIHVRREMHIEPFYKVNRIVIKGPYDDLFKAGFDIKNAIMNLSNKKAFVIGPTYSKTLKAVTIIVKHNLDNINDIYKNIYSVYQSNQKLLIIFDKYPRSL